MHQYTHSKTESRGGKRHSCYEDEQSLWEDSVRGGRSQDKSPHYLPQQQSCSPQNTTSCCQQYVIDMDEPAQPTQYNTQPQESTDVLSDLIQHLEKEGIDPVLAEFLQQEFLGQVMVRQLLDTIEGLQLKAYHDDSVHPHCHHHPQMTCVA